MGILLSIPITWSLTEGWYFRWACYQLLGTRHVFFHNVHSSPLSRKNTGSNKMECVNMCKNVAHSNKPGHIHTLIQPLIFCHSALSLRSKESTVLRKRQGCLKVLAQYSVPCTPKHSSSVATFPWHSHDNLSFTMGLFPHSPIHSQHSLIPPVNIHWHPQL